MRGGGASGHIAIDGKRLRGSATATAQGVHLLVAALVQTGDTSKCSFRLARILYRKYRVLDCRRSSALEASAWQFELVLADAVHQFDARNRGRRAPEPLGAEHHSDALLHASMVLLHQVVQVFRRAQPRVRGQQALGPQFAHRPVRGGVAVQRDRLRDTSLAFDRFAEERFGDGDIATGA